MAKQKQQSAQPESEAQDASAETRPETEPSISAEPGPEPGPAPSPYYVAEAEIFLALLRSLRIEVKAGEEPSSTAERISRLHCDLVLKARQIGMTIH